MKFAKVMFLHVSISHSVHMGGGGIPACIVGFCPPAGGGWPRHTPRGEVEGSGLGGSPGPHPWVGGGGYPSMHCGQFASHWNAFFFSCSFWINIVD